MKIALIGYGKMGKTIESIAISRGHEIVLTIDRDNYHELTPKNLQKADVAIEFTIPDSAISNYKACFEAGVPVVSGTTGWLANQEKVVDMMKSNDGTFFYASNFSVGVNLFFALNQKLAQLMKPWKEYDVSMEEVHHTQKLDEPSGTAITLAEGILDILPSKESWTLERPDANQIHIEAIREGQVPGTHRIEYDSEVDTIKIEHKAKTRHGFALGAVLAAEYSKGKNGLLKMNDLLNL